MIKYIATIKEWHDKINGNTYFSAQIDDIEKEKIVVKFECKELKVNA